MGKLSHLTISGYQLRGDGTHRSLHCTAAVPSTVAEPRCGPAVVAPAVVAVGGQIAKQQQQMGGPGAGKTDHLSLPLLSGMVLPRVPNWSHKLSGCMCFWTRQGNSGFPKRAYGHREMVLPSGKADHAVACQGRKEYLLFHFIFRHKA